MEQKKFIQVLKKVVKDISFYSYNDDNSNSFFIVTYFRLSNEYNYFLITELIGKGTLTVFMSNKPLSV